MAMDAERVTATVTEWCARDKTRALVPSDRAAIDATIAARAFVIERLLSGSHADLFHGCLVLGRLLAEHGGSPTLVAATMDGALEAVGMDRERAADWIVSARAALAEGYHAAQDDAAKLHAMAAWRFPRCAVRVDARTMTFAAGAPDDDEEALREWASQVAHAAQRAGVKRALVDGSEAARRALAEALDLAGIEIVAELAPKGRFRFSWGRW